MKTKLFTLSFFILLFGSTGFSQVYKYLYHLDANFNSVEQSKSLITGKGYNDNGLFKLDCFNRVTEELLISASFKDSSLGTLEGLFRTYSNQKIEEEGNYVNNEMQGLWQNWDKNGLKTDSMIYEKGYKIAYAKFDYLKDLDKKYLYRYSFTDSLKNIYSEKLFSEKGNLKTEAYIHPKTKLFFYLIYMLF